MRLPSGDPRVRRLLLGLLLLLGVLVAAVLLLQRAVIYPRGFVRPSPAGFPALPDAVSLAKDLPGRGRVEAFLLPGDGAAPGRPGPLVVFFHGNAELVDFVAPGLERYRRLGAGVLLVEYRGYGRSAGRPTQRRLVADAVEMLDLATSRPEVDAERVVLHGRSLGGGVACAVARERPPRALILESSFTSVSALAAAMLVPPFLILDRYDNLDLVRAWRGPLLIVHGRRDTIVPFAHAERLIAACPRAELLALDCGHNDLPWNEEYWSAVSDFLRRGGVLR